MFRKIEVATNIIVCSLAILVGVVLVRKEFYPQSEHRHVDESLKIGDHFAANTPFLRSGETTLVLALKTECRFCDDHVTFYRHLRSLQKESEAFELVAIFPYSEPAVSKWKANHRIDIRSFSEVSFADLKIVGTPSIFLVDENRKVNHLWVGRLSAEAEGRLIVG